MDASSGETNRPWLQRGTRLAEAAMAAHDEKEDFAFRASNGFAVMSEGERRIQTQPHLTARLPLHQGRSKFRAGRGLFLPRSEEHTSELQSRGHLVCRLLLEKKNT